MTRAPAFAGVILATGEPWSLNREKALLSGRGGTFLSAHIEALKPYTDFVLVVAGANLAELEPVVDASGAFLVADPHSEHSEFSLVQVGLQEVLNRGRDAAIVTPVVAPPVRLETAQKLRHAFEQADSSIWAIVPEHAGQQGYPGVFGREMITAILRAPVTSNLREVKQNCEQHVACVTVEEDLLPQNIKFPQEHQGIAHE